MEGEGRLVVAMADPEQRVRHRRPAHPHPRTRSGRCSRGHEEIHALLGQTSRLDSVVADLVEESGGAATARWRRADIADASDDAPVVRLVNSLIARGGQRARLGHPHGAAGQGDARPLPGGRRAAHRRRRRRSAWRTGSRAGSRSWPTWTSPSGACPRTAASALTVGGRALDLRVATLPTVYGEKIVMRILDKSNVLLQLSELGFAPRRARAVRGALLAALRRGAGHRPDRLGQVDDASTAR